MIVTEWQHSPEHRFEPEQTYMITGATLYKQHYFKDSESLKYLQTCLLKVATHRGWLPEAWAVFSNHYHLIAFAGDSASTLKALLQEVHSRTAIWINKRDAKPSRIVWYQYWDRCLTIESSYYARLNYVNDNAVHHGLVRVASDYPYCSARLFETGCCSSYRRKLSTYKFDTVKEPDDYSPIWKSGVR